MSKAYDWIEWNYLFWILKKMKFFDRWIRLINQCVTTVQFWIHFNGVPSVLFSPYRNIRDGDPLSLYLFILCVVRFSCLINHAVKQGVWKGVCRGNKLQYYHTCSLQTTMFFFLWGMPVRVTNNFWIFIRKYEVAS